jgi:hypothetical protein
MIVVFAVVVIRSARVEFALFRFIIMDMVRARAYFEVHVGNRSQAHPFPNVSQYKCHEEERFANSSSGGVRDKEPVCHEIQILLPLVFASINISISSKLPPPFFPRLFRHTSALLDGVSSTFHAFITLKRRPVGAKFQTRKALATNSSLKQKVELDVWKQLIVGVLAVGLRRQ